MRLHYTKDVRAALLDELAAAGYPPATTRLESAPGECWVTVPDDTDPAGVAAVVAAHNPTALDAAAAQDAQQADGDRTTLRQGAAALLADAQALEGTGTLTAAQQRAMLARTDRAVLALGRLLRRAGVI